VALFCYQFLSRGIWRCDFLDFENSKMVTSKRLYVALAIFLCTTSLFASQQFLRVGVAGQMPFINAEKVPSVPGGAAVDI
jgi:hypothetical protein